MLLMLIPAVWAAPAAHAAEGMWTLDKLPLSRIQEKYGFTPTPLFTEKAMKASLRMAGGCSASFVSNIGLVMTNRHCVNECIQQLSTAEQNYIETGFLAKRRKDELKCPQIELNKLEAITDVTVRIKQATKGKSGGDYSTAQKAEKSNVEAECVAASTDADRTRCDVVELYQGGRYALYQYHRYQDVRLVFAPEQDIAFFGGDPDNFNFPRYDLDVAFLHAYEKGMAVEPEQYFRFTKGGAEAGEVVFVTGHPGSTDRQLTQSQLETLRDITLPANLLRYAELRGMLNQYATTSAEASRVSQDDRFGIDNSFKAIYGEHKALLDPKVFQKKSDDEKNLHDYLAKHAPLAKQVGEPWAEVDAAQTVYRKIETRLKLIEGGRGFWTEYFRIARVLVRGSQERAKPNETRLREFAETALPSLTQELFAAAPIAPDYEKVKLAWSLGKLRELLGPDDKFVKTVLGRQSPEAMAARLIDGTHLGDVELRKKLWEGGAAAIAASDDPFILLAKQIDDEARALRKQNEDDVEAVVNNGAERIARVRFAMQGLSEYPDATFTLRLSYGEIAGWQLKGQPVEPFTVIGGAFERETGTYPYALPPSWIKAKSALKSSQRFNMVTTNDIIGGNSGSPVINQRGQIVGLIFDGNIESLAGAFYYDESVNRAVAVHSGAIVEALDKVYGADTILKELGLQ